MSQLILSFSYGLLGASGCGKTTLIRTLLGISKLNSGLIWILGGSPGTRNSGSPGPQVGYMSQDLALYTELSIYETLKYFGWIAGMSAKRLQDRIVFLMNFLALPEPSRHINKLSGGQQRRVSLAAALLHEPELLILDEPTVGVDPILRKKFVP